MRSVLVFFGLLSVFMLVSSLPLGPAALEKRQSSSLSIGAGGIIGGSSSSSIHDSIGKGLGDVLSGGVASLGKGFGGAIDALGSGFRGVFKGVGHLFGDPK